VTVAPRTTHAILRVARTPQSRQAPRSERPTRAFPYLQNPPPRSSGNKSGLGLRPARPPGLFFSRLWPGPWRPLFRPDPTSLSTSVDTGDRGACDRKPDDNARAKSGARECRQDQNHDHPLTSGKQQPQIPRALPIDMRCKSDASSPSSRGLWPPKYRLAVAGMVNAPCQPIRRAVGLGPRARSPAGWEVKSPSRPTTTLWEPSMTLTLHLDSFQQREMDRNQLGLDLAAALDCQADGVCLRASGHRSVHVVRSRKCDGRWLGTNSESAAQAAASDFRSSSRGELMPRTNQEWLLLATPSLPGHRKEVLPAPCTIASA
jgi:hypothetical protein